MPSHVYTHTDLPEYFEFVSDIHNPDICEKFENGVIQVFDSFPLLDGVDLEFLARIGPAEDTKAIRKTSEQQMLADMGEGALQDHILRHFTDNERDARNLQQLILDLSERYRQYFRDILPGYEVEKEKNTWRFTETRGKNMHLDNYYHPDKFYIRMFTNLDLEPRVWRTSYTFEDAFEMQRDAVSDLAPNEICFALNDLIFGPSTFWKENEAAGFTFPYHEFHFQPGTAWLVYSQRISHQIEYGNRMLSSTGILPAAGMQNPEQSFDAILRSLREPVAAE